MQMWMITKSLAPDVKHCKEADLGARCLGAAAMVRKASVAARNRLL